MLNFKGGPHDFGENKSANTTTVIPEWKNLPIACPPTVITSHELIQTHTTLIQTSDWVTSHVTNMWNGQSHTGLSYIN